MSTLKKEKLGDSISALYVLFQSQRFSKADYESIKLKYGYTNEQDIVKQMLNEWGIGFDKAVQTESNGNRIWCYDSITYLSKNPCIIGFLIHHGEDDWRCVRNSNNQWDWQESVYGLKQIENHCLIQNMLNYECPVYIVWKQWIPLQRWIRNERPFYVRCPDTKAKVRWEYEPTSCWMPQKMSYIGKDKTLKKILSKWSSPCLMSNKKQFIVLKPDTNGWSSETVMEFDGLPIGTVSDRLAELTLKEIDTLIEKNPIKKKEIMPVLAHALMSVAFRFGIKINHQQLSAFQLDEMDSKFIRNYDKMLEKVNT